MASLCAVCSKIIQEASSATEGEDAVFCEGCCQRWIHRQCIGMSVPLFQALTKSQAPFYCVYCSQVQISQLQNKIECLETKLVSLLPANSVPSNVASKADVCPSSYSAVVQSNLPESQPNIKPQKIAFTIQSSRKFNLVVYGIEEKPTGTLKHIRLMRDTDDVSKVFNQLGLLSLLNLFKTVLDLASTRIVSVARY